MIYEVFMPALSSTMTEGKIVSWVKAPGDKVEKGETVVVVESDKADMDVESFYEGYLGSIVVPAGESAPVGAAIALIAETEAEIAPAQQQAAGQAAPVETPGAIADAKDEVAAVAAPVASVQNGTAAGGSATTQNGRVVVSPRARKLSKELKVDLNTLSGSGPHGRIVAEDVEAAAGRQPAAKTPTAPPPPQPSVTPPVAKPAVAPPAPAVAGQQVPLTTLQN